MDFVDRLTALRIDKDITQEEIAKILYCKQSAVSKYEKRRVQYTAKDIYLLCKFYNVSADYIFGFPKDMPYPEK